MKVVYFLGCALGFVLVILTTRVRYKGDYRVRWTAVFVSTALFWFGATGITCACYRVAWSKSPFYDPRCLASAGGLVGLVSLGALPWVMGKAGQIPCSRSSQIILGIVMMCAVAGWLAAMWGAVWYVHRAFNG